MTALALTLWIFTQSTSGAAAMRADLSTYATYAVDDQAPSGTPANLRICVPRDLPEDCPPWFAPPGWYTREELDAWFARVKAKSVAVPRPTK